MMKHPKYRVPDILLLEPGVRAELFAMVLGWVRDFMPVSGSEADFEKIRKYVNPKYQYGDIDFTLGDVEICGSLAFGNSTLSSDIDVNVAMTSEDSQIPMKRWFHSGRNRAALADACQQFEIQTGLRIDIGCTSWENKDYNVVASILEKRLYNRGRPAISNWGEVNRDSIEWVERGWIDLDTFDPSTMELPTIYDGHLLYDAYVHGWRTKVRNFPRKARWAEDPWAQDVPEWAERYGDHFQTYHIEGTELVMD